MRPESQGPITNEDPGIWPIVTALIPIEQIRASKSLLTDKRWGLFFYRFSMVGLILLLTGGWIIAQVYLVIIPWTQLSGPLHSQVLGFLGHLVVWGTLFYGYVWLVSNRILDITDREYLPEPGLKDRPWTSKLYLLFTGGVFLALVGPIRYGMIETTSELILNTQASLFTRFGHILGLLVTDMIYGGAFMLGLGFVITSYYIGKEPSESVRESRKP